MSTILDAFPRPIAVRVRGLSVDVPALTLGALADLQAFARDHSWDPWEPPGVVADRPDLFWALVLTEADEWPPPIGTPVAGDSVPDGPYADELAYVAFGRHNGFDRPTSARVGAIAREDMYPWQRIMAAAYVNHPRDEASRILNILDGAAKEADFAALDWALAIVRLVVEPPHYTFAQAEALSLPQFRLICRARQDKRGRLELAPEKKVTPRPRPGERQKDADLRRKAIRAEAESILQAHYDAAGVTNGAVRDVSPPPPAVGSAL